MEHDRDSNQPAGQALGAGASQPAEQPEEKSHPEYRISIFRDWCKSCGICAAFCPRQCLSLDANGDPVVDHAERCTGCRWCELHCPDFAICIKELVPVEKQAED